MSSLGVVPSDRRAVIIIGVDPASTRLALVALLPSGSYVAQKIDNLSGGKKRSPWSPEACAAAATVTTQFVEVLRRSWHSESIHAVVESPVVGRAGPRSTMVQSFTSGAVQSALVQAGATVQLVNVQSWKKDVIGHGHATKADVAEALRLRWPTLHTAAAADEDLLDAAAIALWGQEHLPG